VNKQEQKHVKVIFSNTYDLDAYHYALVSEEEFQRLEALRDGKMWVWVGEEDENGYIDTYHGKAD
jgi:hypothetical protein